jgi:repressor LexA
MMTPRQKQLLDFLSAEAREGRCPTFDEMRTQMGLANKSTIHHLIVSLEERGFIRRLPNRARAIEVRVPSFGPTPARISGTFLIPLVGRIDRQPFSSCSFLNQRTVEQVWAEGGRR